MVKRCSLDRTVLNVFFGSGPTHGGSCGTGVKTKTAIISIDDLDSESAPKLSVLLKGILGVETVDFSLERKVAVVEFDPEQTQLDDLLRAVLKEGYHVS